MFRKTAVQSRPAIRDVSGADLDLVFGAADGISPLATVTHMKSASASDTLLGEMLSNIAKTRAEISMTFARNARA